MNYQMKLRDVTYLKKKKITKQQYGGKENAKTRFRLIAGSMVLADLRKSVEIEIKKGLRLRSPEFLFQHAYASIAWFRF